MLRPSRQFSTKKCRAAFHFRKYALHFRQFFFSFPAITFPTILPVKPVNPCSPREVEVGF